MPHEGNLRRPRYAKGELKRIRVKSAEELRRDWEREKRRGERESRGEGTNKGKAGFRRGQLLYERKSIRIINATAQCMGLIL